MLKDFKLLNLQNSGQIAPLDEIIKLKEKYRFRILLDESNSFGVLGRFGKGLTEYYEVPVSLENTGLFAHYYKLCNLWWQGFAGGEDRYYNCSYGACTSH